MLHFGYKTSSGRGGGEEEQGEGGGGGGGLKNLPQFRLLQSRLGPTQEAAVLNPSPRSHVPYPTKYTVTHTNSNFTLAGPAAGSQKRDGKSTTSRGSSSCGREDSLLPTRRGQVHPQSDTTRGFCFPPFPKSLSSVLSSRISPSLARLRSNHHIPPRP